MTETKNCSKPSGLHTHYVSPKWCHPPTVTINISQVTSLPVRKKKKNRADTLAHSTTFLGSTWALLIQPPLNYQHNKVLGISPRTSLAGAALPERWTWPALFNLESGAAKGEFHVEGRSHQHTVGIPLKRSALIYQRFAIP